MWAYPATGDDMEVVGFVCRPWTSGEFNSKFMWFWGIFGVRGMRLIRLGAHGGVGRGMILVFGVLCYSVLVLGLEGRW